jgi:hypothetical protein
MRSWIRVWEEKDITEIEKHLMIVGDLKGDCASCKELGLDYRSVKQCPRCQTVFSYITCRRFETNPGERFQIVKRLADARNDLKWIDYDDYKKLTGRQRARDFFSS